MNAPSQSESTALAVAENNFAIGTPMDAASLILGPAFDRVQAFAGLMCKGAVTVPQHLRGNPGDCMAVTLAALSRRMDPFAFAQKTHITKSGALGYEAQLIKAMITTSGKVDGQPEYDFLGDWSRILGKVAEKTSDKGGKYYVATYTKEDESGLGVVIRWRLRGESAPRSMTVMLSQCYPRFSTQWATDPQQQICYVADRKFARRYCPDTLLGVYDVEELETGEPKFMGPADVVQPGAAATSTGPAAGLPVWDDAEVTKREAKIAEFYSRGKKAEEIIAFYANKATLSEALKQRIRNLQPAATAPAADTATDVTPKVTYAAVADKIVHAMALTDLDTAEDLIGSVTDAQQRSDLVALAKDRRTNLEELAR